MNIAAEARYNFPDHIDVGGGAYERNRDRIHTLLESELEILPVFLSHRRNRQGGAGQVDALVFAEHSTVENVANDISTAHAAHPQLNQAVTQKNACAGDDLTS